MIKNSERRVFVGSHVRPETKVALVAHVHEQKTTVSEFISNMIEETLKAHGVAVVHPAVNMGEKLPFEGGK